MAESAPQDPFSAIKKGHRSTVPSWWQEGEEDKKKKLKKKMGGGSNQVVSQAGVEKKAAAAAAEVQKSGRIGHSDPLILCPNTPNQLPPGLPLMYCTGHFRLGNASIPLGWNPVPSDDLIREGVFPTVDSLHSSVLTAHDSHLKWNW